MVVTSTEPSAKRKTQGVFDTLVHTTTMLMCCLWRIMSVSRNRKRKYAQFLVGLRVSCLLHAPTCWRVCASYIDAPTVAAIRLANRACHPQTGLYSTPNLVSALQSDTSSRATAILECSYNVAEPWKTKWFRVAVLHHMRLRKIILKPLKLEVDEYCDDAETVLLPLTQFCPGVLRLLLRLRYLDMYDLMETCLLDGYMIPLVRTLRKNGIWMDSRMISSAEVPFGNEGRMRRVLDQMYEGKLCRCYRNGTYLCRRPEFYIQQWCGTKYKVFREDPATDVYGALLLVVNSCGCRNYDEMSTSRDYHMQDYVANRIRHGWSAGDPCISPR